MIYKQYRYIKVGGGQRCYEFMWRFQITSNSHTLCCEQFDFNNEISNRGPRCAPGGGWLGTTPAHACMDMCINHVWLYNPVCVHACQNPPSVNNSFIPPSTYVRIYVRTSLVWTTTSSISLCSIDVRLHALMDGRSFLCELADCTHSIIESK